MKSTSFQQLVLISVLVRNTRIWISTAHIKQQKSYAIFLVSAPPMWQWDVKKPWAVQVSAANRDGEIFCSHWSRPTSLCWPASFLFTPKLDWLWTILKRKHNVTTGCLHNSFTLHTQSRSFPIGRGYSLSTWHQWILYTVTKITPSYNDRAPCHIEQNECTFYAYINYIPKASG